MIAVKEHPGNKQVFLKMERIDEDTRRAIRKGFFRLGISLRKTASRQILAKDKTGRVYLVRRGKRVRRHRASAPGQSPANLSGNYRRNIGFEIKGAEKMDFGGREDYSGFLEDGTSRMEPRPGLGNAVKVENKNAMQYFEIELQRGLKL